MKKHTVLLIIGVLVLGVCLLVMSKPSVAESRAHAIQARETAKRQADSVEFAVMMSHYNR